MFEWLLHMSNQNRETKGWCTYIGVLLVPSKQSTSYEIYLGPIHISIKKLVSKIGFKDIIFG